MNISQVSATNPEVIALIEKAALPIKDIADNIELFALTENEKVIGTIGMEHDETIALLRSLSVDETERGKGYGDALVSYLENAARNRGIKIIYLLTTTAASFFARKEYVTVDRSQVPAFLQSTSEFSSVCPASAIVMKKILA